MPETADERHVLGQFIPLHYHYNMLTDEARMAGFKEALEHLVPRGGKVLELGGGTGVLSFFAARNASKVWCVEHNPELVEAARRILALNDGGEKIEVIQGDAMEYLPPEPVDVVICEMLHVGLLREKQVEVIASFKERYQARFGPDLPVFVPEASILALQPVQQTFEVHGFYAPVLFFQQPGVVHDATRELAQPALFQTVDYRKDLPGQCAWDGTITVEEPGMWNAIRFVTKNVLAILVNEQRTVDWFNQYLILPLDEPLDVLAGDAFSVSFSYRVGAQIDELASSLTVQRAPA
jgi:type I protein arginine methyltransferase